jgi:hypothetical protein
MKTYSQYPLPKDTAWGRKTWRTYIPYWLLNFIDGVKNIITWIPIIYKDKNWDHSYIYDIIEFKLLQQRNYLVSANRHTSIPETNRDITICLNLIQRIKNEYYSSEYLDYYDSDMKFIPVKGKDTYTLESTIIWEKFDLYLNKYPLQVKKILKEHPEFKDDKFRIIMWIGRKNEKRAQLLLFKIMNEKINHWWD